MKMRLGFIYGMGFEVLSEDFEDMDSREIIDELSLCYAHQYPFYAWEIF